MATAQFLEQALSEAKRKWSTYRREMMAVQQGIRNFRDEIAGRHLNV